MHTCRVAACSPRWEQYKAAYQVLRVGAIAGDCRSVRGPGVRNDDRSPRDGEQSSGHQGIIIWESTTGAPCAMLSGACRAWMSCYCTCSSQTLHTHRCSEQLGLMERSSTDKHTMKGQGAASPY